MRILTKYLLPAALVAGFLFCFVQIVFFDHYPNTDDWVYDNLVHKHGIAETIKLLFRIDTGRWFSHVIAGFSFYFLGHNFFLYGVYLSAMMALFALGLALVYKNYSRTFLRRTVSFSSQLTFSLLSSATLFFMVFAGRQQSFGWVSSSINHLLSVTLCLFLTAILFKGSRSILNTLLVVIFSLMIGGSNEVNAICMILCVAVFFLLSLRHFAQIKFNKQNMILAIIFITLALLLNLSSGGYEGRMNGLPSFSYYQSFKNTVHSFLMPFLEYMYLPLFLGALVIFILYFKKKDHHYTRRTLIIFGSAAGIGTISFFLNCFLLSDVVPARAALWAYTLAILTLGLFLVSDKTETKAS